MPHYRFHLVSREAQVPDCDGLDLADRWAARREAFLIADDLVKPGAPAQLRKWRGWSLQVVDERDSEILFVPIGNERVGAGEPTTARPDEEPDRADRRGVRRDAYGTTMRLAAEAIRHAEHCRQLQRAVITQIEFAKETVRLSAELIERGKTLPAGILPR